MAIHPALARASAFAERFGLRLPILLAPMAGACPPALSAAVANAGGLGGAGALLMAPDAIVSWAAQFRAASNGAFQLNLWVPDPPPRRDPEAEAAIRTFLATHGPEVPPEAAEARLIDFATQCEALLAAAPAAVSSIMGLFPPDFVARLKQAGIAWFATVTTLGEALEAEAAGADAVIAQGMEAGGHRGAFQAALAEAHQVGLFALIPALSRAVRIPVIATGGIADGPGVAAALLLGASAAQVGTGFLRCPEAAIPTAWAAALATARPEATQITRAFSGRPGRALSTAYVRAAATGPNPAPYPIQRALTAPMRQSAQERNDLDAMQAWSGQSAALATGEPAADYTRRLWDDAQAALRA